MERTQATAAQIPRRVVLLLLLYIAWPDLFVVFRLAFARHRLPLLFCSCVRVRARASCIFYGMGSGIDVLCTQAFGAKEPRLIGATLARGTLLTAALFVPVAFLWYDMERVLLSVGECDTVTVGDTAQRVRSTF